MKHARLRYLVHITIPHWLCQRCGAKWPAGDGDVMFDAPVRCAACRSPYWQKPRKIRKALGKA